MGHEDTFPRPGPNGRCRFGQETFAGVRANGRDAPIAGIGRSSDYPPRRCSGKARLDVGALNSTVRGPAVPAALSVYTDQIERLLKDLGLHGSATIAPPEGLFLGLAQLELLT